MRADRSHPPDNWFLPCAELASSVADTEPFSVIVDQVDPAVVVVSVVGEIDMLTESSLHDDLSGALAMHPERLVIDLSRVSFLSAAGLSVLISAKHTATHHGTALQLRVPDRRVMARSLAMAGLDYLSGTSSTAKGVPHPPETDRDGASVLAGPASVVETGPDEYAHLVPLQRRYAELALDDPERRSLRDTLISGYLQVAEHIARRFAGRGEPLDDLVQVATMGLINAVDRFEPSRGSAFLSFAVPTITGELRRYFRDHGWSARVPRRLKDLTLAVKNAQGELSQELGRAARPSEIAERLEVSRSRVIEALHAAEAYKSSSLDELLSSRDATATCAEFIGDVDDQTCLIDDREALRPLLAELAPRERTILALRFFHELTQTQIAKQVGISQMHVSRVLRQTLAFLRQRMTTATASSRPAPADDAVC
jgi:RNA polymerase sigma-B factor